MLRVYTWLCVSGSFLVGFKWSVPTLENIINEVWKSRENRDVIKILFSQISEASCVQMNSISQACPDLEKQSKDMDLECVNGREATNFIYFPPQLEDKLQYPTSILKKILNYFLAN